MLGGLPVRASDDVDSSDIAATIDRAAMKRIEAALAECGDEVPRLLTSTGEEVELPVPLIHLLHDAARRLAEGQAVQLLAADAELTTQQAADLLNISRPYLIRLLDGGKLPHHYVGSHRRILVKDLLSYKRRRDQERHAALRELTQLSQELGLYDTPPR
jgi:excisionase family DNA binding protein